MNWSTLKQIVLKSFSFTLRITDEQVNEKRQPLRPASQKDVVYVWGFLTSGLQVLAHFHPSETWNCTYNHLSGRPDLWLTTFHFHFPFSISIYAFSRRFYPKWLTVHSGYTFFFQYVCSLGIEPTTFCTANTMLYHWATGTTPGTFFFSFKTKLTWIY